LEDGSIREELEFRKLMRKIYLLEGYTGEDFYTVEDFFRKQIEKAVLQVSFLGKDQSVLAACAMPASKVAIVLNVPLLVQEDRLPEKYDKRLRVQFGGYIPIAEYVKQSQEWKDDPELIRFFENGGWVPDKLNKVQDAYDKEYGGPFHRLYGEDPYWPFKEDVDNPIRGASNAVVIARDAGITTLSVKAPAAVVKKIEKVTAGFDLGGASKVDGLMARNKGIDPRRKELLEELIRRWHRLTSEERAKMSEVPQTAGMMLFEAKLSLSHPYPSVFCIARSSVAE
jgi:hypothetical protein